MDYIRLGDTIVKDFTTHNPTTGAVNDADSTPSAEVFEDTNDTAILTPTVTKRTSKTGNYRMSIAVTDGNGFEIGKSYNVVVSATVGTIAAKKTVLTFTVDSPSRQIGAVVSDGGNSVTSFKTDLGSSKTDYCKDSWLLFITGTNVAQQVKKITAFNGSTKFVTVSGGFTDIPTAGDKFVLINE